MSAPRAPRRWARRAVLSVLAGGGLTAGLGGPGAALGAEAPTGTAGTGEGTTPPVTTTSPQTPAPAQEGAGSSAEPSTTTSTAPASPSAPAESSGTSTAPAGASTTPAEAPSVAPTVVVQRTQQVTAGRRTGASVTKGSGAGGQGGASKPAGEGAAKNGPTTVPPGTPNGVAPAPQAAGGEAAGLAALFADSAVSAQALDFYRIPLFLLPVYKAAAFQYDIPWQVLAAINEVETDYGTDLSVSTAGAVGWMQFMPSTWLRYGVDATEAGYADPANPVDAIFAAARYLHAAGASHNLDAAILAYNHSQEYVESVLLRARLIASFPRSVIGTLTGLVDGRAPTAGAHLAPGSSGLEASLGSGGAAGVSPTSPASGSSSATAGAVPLGTAPTPASAAATAPTPEAATAPTPEAATAPTPADAGAGAPSATSPAGTVAPAVAAHAGSGTSAAAATQGFKPPPPPQVAARRAEAAANRPAKPSQLVELLGAPNAPVRAVDNGRIEHLGHSHALGRYLVLRDVYGDVFTYAGLGSIAPRYHPTVSTVEHRVTASRDPAPTQPATAGHQSPLTLKVRHHAAPAPLPSASTETEGETAPAGMGRVRLYAHPGNPLARAAAASAAKATGTGNGRWLPLRTGSIVSEGTVLGRLDTPVGASAGQLRFAVRPAGDSSTIDPQPLLANWRQLGAALHPKGSRGANALLGATAGDALLMSKGELELAVLSDPGIQLDACGRRDVASGAVDGRVLAVLEFLSRSGLQPTVAALRCPRGGVSPSGLSLAPSADAAASRVAHDRGTAVEITAINGVPIAGHQGQGTVADAAIRTLLTLSGRFAPHRIVSLMKYPEAPATQALPSAWDHIYVDFLPRRPVSAHAASARAAATSPLTVMGALNGAQWSQLIGRIAGLPKPTVATGPSSTAIRDPQAAPTNRELGAHG
jgi:Transglycosylase SLT domain